MAEKVLGLATLGDLDNRMAGLLIDKAIAEAVADLEDRGEEDRKSRKVVITLDLSITQKLTVAKVHVDVKTPPRESSITAARLRANAGKYELHFQDANNDNPDQPTFREFDEMPDGELRPKREQ